MAKIELTKTVVDSAQSTSTSVELRDTIVPGFLLKVTPTGRKVFMLQYRTNGGQRRKPSLGLFCELTVDQARTLAQDWLADVRRGGDPGGDKRATREAPTVKKLCARFMEDYSVNHNKPSTQRTNQYQINRKAPDSMHPIGAHHLALPFQENLDAPIAVAWVLRNRSSRARSQPRPRALEIDKRLQGASLPDREKESDAGGAERAFEALRAEVAAMRQAVEGLKKNQPVDTTVTLGSIVKELQTVGEILAKIERYPAINMTPTQHQHALVVAGGDLMRCAVSTPP